jgi:hypothetical protein
MPLESPSVIVDHAGGYFVLRLSNRPVHDLPPLFPAAQLPAKCA